MTRAAAIAALHRISATRTAGARMLRVALDHTGSTCGFTGVVVDRVLRVVEHEGITWHKPTGRKRHPDTQDRSTKADPVEFTNFDNLVGQVLLTAAPVVVNDPQDPRLGRLPLVAYPPLHSFLGVPMFEGERVVGMIGVANRFDGYSTKEREELESVAGKPKLRRAASF
jgi:GAF domain-containing protein